MAKKSTSKKSTVSKTSKAAARKKSTASSVAKKSGAAAKTATASKSKKATAKKPTTKAASVAKKSTSKKNGVPAVLKGLRGLHMLSAVVYAGLIAAVYLALQVVERTLTLGYATSDQLLGGDTLAPAVRNVVSVDVRHVLAVGLGVGVLYSVYVATKGWKKYSALADTESVRSRWMFSGVGVAIASVLVALVHGVYDVVQLGLMAIMLVVATVLASKVYAVTDKRVRMRVFLTALLLGSFSVLALALFILFSMMYGAQALPLGLYAAADVFALGVLAYALNQYAQLKGSKRVADSRVLERNYVLITLVTAVGVTASVLFGLMA